MNRAEAALWAIAAVLVMSARPAAAEVHAFVGAELIPITGEVISDGVLVIDDLVDTGKTLEVVRQLYPKAHFATVYAKPKGKPLVQTYITEVSQDTWIFFPWDMALMYVEPYRGTE